MKESEEDLRAALQSAYAFGDGYPDHATVQLIAGSVRQPSRRARIPASVGAAAAVLATMAIAAAVILTLLLSPRGAMTRTQPAAVPSQAPLPSPSIIYVKQAAIGIGTGGGRVTFDAHYLPADAKVTVAVQSGGASIEIISTTADAQGDALGTASMPASITGPSADFTICVTPDASSSATPAPGWKGKVCLVRSVPVASSSAPTRTP